MPHVRVVPIRAREHSDAFGVDVSRIVGYRAQQGDEWRGPARSTYREAATDASDRSAELRQTSSPTV